MSPSFVYNIYWYLHSRRECISSQQGHSEIAKQFLHYAALAKSGCKQPRLARCNRERHRVQIEDLCDGCISLSHAEGCSGSVLSAFYKCSSYGNIAFVNQFYVITHYLREARTLISYLASNLLVFVATSQILARHKLHFHSQKNDIHNSCHCWLCFLHFY